MSEEKEIMSSADPEYVDREEVMEDLIDLQRQLTYNTWHVYNEQRKAFELAKSQQPPKPAKRRRRGPKTYGRKK